MTALFEKFAPAIRSLNLSEVRHAAQIPAAFDLAREGSLSAHYIPFDWVNPAARIVIVGITPGFTQWQNAMREAQKQLIAGKSPAEALREAKRTGAFSGPMRPNLVALLDHFGLNQWLGIKSCESLFSTDAHLVQTTSALRHPIFVDGENYNGTPGMTQHRLLQNLLLEHFGPEAQQLKKAVLVPLGPKVSEALAWLVQKGKLDGARVLDGMPHPSGANAERIAYMLGRKPREALSTKTNAVKLDEAAESLREKIAAL
jgi:hypothetical protein